MRTHRAPGPREHHHKSRRQRTGRGRVRRRRHRHHHQCRRIRFHYTSAQPLCGRGGGLRWDRSGGPVQRPSVHGVTPRARQREHDTDILLRIPTTAARLGSPIVCILQTTGPQFLPRIAMDQANRHSPLSGTTAATMRANRPIRDLGALPASRRRDVSPIVKISTVPPSNPRAPAAELTSADYIDY